MGRLATAVALLATVLCIATPSALAWKPFTHVYTADKAYTDVVADGEVTIDGQSYDVDPTIVTALKNQRAYYNGGVIGPDGFPDLVYGQSYIHPEKTGEWLRLILTKAWEAQSDASYSAAEKEQILAFAYGFMTHAAGDMWAHTFVNDFSKGVFPAIFGIINGIDDPMVAVRHLIVEGYMGDATPGYDGNKERGPVAGEQNEDGDADFSDDSSTRIDFAAPTRFVYETLVNPANPLPFGTCGDGLDDDHDGVADDGCPGGPFTVNGGPDLNVDGEPDGDGPEPRRGKLIDFFLDMQADLEVDLFEYEFDSSFEECAYIDPDCHPHTYTRTVHTVRGDKTIQIDSTICTADVFCVGDVLDGANDVAILDLLVKPYVSAWIDDIVDGLRAWPELGLASTKALFDPGTHRDAQNHICRTKVGSESDESSQRSLCEEGVGVLDDLDFAMEDFIHDHLLSMLGAPDLVGDLLDAMDVLGEVFEDILGPVLNPITAPLDELKAFIKDKLQEAIEDATGVDIDELKSFLTSPNHWLDVDSFTITLPFVGTVVNADFFDPPTTHERLDQLMHLPDDHHTTQTVFVPGLGNVPSTGLGDDATFDEDDFAAFANTVQQAKLLLLRGDGLNAVLKHELVSAGVIKSTATVSTYADGATPTNVMFQQLSGPESWLRLIDGDHQWRVNGLPRFCDAGTAGCPDGQVGPPTARPARLDGGAGTYPIWESCVNRPAFAALYADWENGADQFPELGDGTSPDPTDPDAPDPDLTLTAPPGHIFTSAAGTVYAAADHTFTASATETVFVDSKVQLQYRSFLASGPAPGAEAGWTAIPSGGTFRIAGTDGLYKVQIRSADPCHTFTVGDALPAGTPETQLVYLDTTPPEITISSPADGALFDTDDFAPITWSATDVGSGVAGTSGTFDGAATSNGATLDMFTLYPGAHSVTVSATDNVGNSATKTNAFQLHATSLSLLHNVQRACGESGAWPATPLLITKAGICTGMKAILAQAVTKHAGGAHATEQQIVDGWVGDVEAQRGKAVDPATADRFVAYGNDLIATNG
jgi:hypothetical protein